MMNERVLVIEPGRRERHYWSELWAYRELFLILAWRDVAVRYKQTLIGVAWAVLRPFLTMVVFSLVFGKLAGLPSDGGAPYPLMVLAGMLPWFLVSSAFGGAADSIVANANLIGKVYFPRMIVPASSLVVALIDFLISLGLLLALMAWYRYVPTWRLALLPLLLLLALATTLGPALWVSALNARYRDVRHVVPFALQFGLYVSPVGFSSTVVPEEWRLLYSVNPLVGVIDGFRWCVLGTDASFYAPGFALSAAVAAALLILGVRAFRRAERSFADVV